MEKALLRSKSLESAFKKLIFLCSIVSDISLDLRSMDQVTTLSVLIGQCPRVALRLGAAGAGKGTLRAAFHLLVVEK